MKLFTLAAIVAATASTNPFSPKYINNAKAKYVNDLLSKAKTLRTLNDNRDQYPVDISGYSVKFEKCQFVRMYDDEIAEKEESASVLGISRFAIFRLCPSHNCEFCSYNYGEYIVDLDNYLVLTTEYYRKIQEETCKTCENYCEFGDEQNRRHLADQEEMPADLDCGVCVGECTKINNMEQNGYVDATEYLGCQMFYSDEAGNAYYGSAVCASNGSKIKVGVFTDEQCSVAADTEIDSMMEWFKNKNGNMAQKKLSHALLKKTYLNTCISCIEEQKNNNQNQNGDAGDADEVNEVCENLYNYAGKCEHSHGFDKGYYGVQGYENQWAQEDVVCQYIKSLMADAYNEAGEINLSGASFSVGGGSRITGGQIFSLCYFFIGTVVLAVYAAILHSKLTRTSASMGVIPQRVYSDAEMA